MDAMVLTVETVIYNQTKSLPPLMLLHAKGTVNTGGWTKGRLSPYVYVTPPADGIWDFSFIATMPTGRSIQDPSSIESEVLMLSTPEWCKGVRVHASSNFIEVTTESPEFVPEKLTPMNWVPYPWDRERSASERGGGLAVSGGGVDVFPWSAVQEVDQSPSSAEGDQPFLSRPISDLLGRRVRVYRDGEMVTMDYVPERVNIVKSRYGDTITEIKLG